MQRKISVILPAFNEEARIGRCINALRLQTEGDFECIVVDDGSTDSTSEAVKKCIGKDSRFKLFRTENQGLSAARNFGLDMASGDVIFYADADDIPDRNFLLEPMQFLEENGLDIVFFDASLKNEGLDALRWNRERRYFHRGCSHGIKSGRQMFCEMMEDGDFIAPVYLQAAKREAVRWKFMEGILYEDELYTFQNMIYSKKVGHLKKCLYERTCRLGSIVNSERGFLHSFSKWRSAKEIMKLAEGIQPSFSTAEMKAVQELACKCLSFAAKTWLSLTNEGRNPDYPVNGIDWLEYVEEMQTLSETPSMAAIFAKPS